MGRLRSKTYVENVTVGETLLGLPTIVRSDGMSFSPGDSMDNLWFAWDDPRIPSGVLEPDGTITPEPSLIDITQATEA